MRFVDDEHVPVAGGNRRQDLRPLDVVDRSDGKRHRRPGVDVQRKRSGELPQASGVGDSSLEAKPRQQLRGPLIAQTRRGEDQHALGAPARQQLGHHESRLNGLSQPDFVREQESHAPPAHHRQRRLQLVREDVESRAGG
jgi:hypothetical protein